MEIPRSHILSTYKNSKLEICNFIPLYNGVTKVTCQMNSNGAYFFVLPVELLGWRDIER